MPFYKKKERRGNGSGADLEKKLILAARRGRILPSGAQLLRLPRLLKPRERVIFLLALAVFLGSALLLAGSLLTKIGKALPAGGGAYTEAIVGRPSLINPLWADLNAADRDLAALIFSGLFRYGAGLKPEPALAESDSVSEDGQTHTVILRPDLYWHDGAPLTSQDVVFTVSLFKHPAIASPHAPDFEKVTATAPDERTVVFTLEEPRASFLQALTVGILPAHLWSAIPPRQMRLAELNQKPVGSGPFRFSKLRKTKQGAIHSYILEKFDKANPRPYLERITLRFFNNYTEAANALAEANVDGLAFLPRELHSIIARNKRLKSYELDISQLIAIYFNQKSNPLLAEKTVRQALAQATPQDIIIGEAFDGAAKKIFGPILPESIPIEPDLTHHGFDMEHASALLEEDGWKFAEGASVRTFHPKDKKDKRFSKDKELQISLTTVRAPAYQRAAELVRDSWRELGIAVELRIVNTADIDREVIAGRSFDALLYGALVGADPDPYPFWHSSQGASPGVNLAQYANRRVDGLLEEARKIPDEAERGKRYTEFQKVVTAELPAIFLLSPTYSYAIDRDVQGAEFGRLGSPEHRFMGVTDWFVKTKRGIW